MKKRILFFLFLFVLIQVGKTQDSLIYQGVKHRVDTLSFKHDAGLGTMLTSYRLPDVPLNVHVVEIDITNPFLTVESALSNDTLRDLEAPSRMAIRKTSPGHRVVTAINGDFYNITGGADLGLPSNGHATYGQLAKIPHASRSLVAFGEDNAPFIDLMAYSGKLHYSGNEYTINNVNTGRGANQLILYNQYNGKTTKTNQSGTEVILELTAGSWAINDQMTLTVKEIRKGVGAAPIAPGHAVLSGHGTARAVLDGMAVGETVKIDVNISVKNGGPLPKLLNMIGGGERILKNGAINGSNQNALHPRSSIGFSADKKTVYLIMVEGRSDASVGIDYNDLATLFLLSGASDALNLDGGGSSSLVVHNGIVNVSSDGNERRTANTLLFISEAPVAPAVDFKLNTHYIKIPFGNKYQFKASTYNEHGDVVDYLGATGVTYSVVGESGDVDANGLFTATGFSSGRLIAEWGGKKDTAWIKVIPAKGLSFSVNKLTIDHLTNYTFKVRGLDIDDRTYDINNDLVVFESLDESIGTVDNQGVFRGLKDGTVTVKVATQEGDFEDFCTVTVEIGVGHMLLDDFSNPSLWDVTSSYVSNVNLSRVKYGTTDEDVLKVSYDLSYLNRTAYVNLERLIDIYGMPDSLLLEASGNGVSSSIMLTVDHAAGISKIPKFSGDEIQTFRVPIQVEGIAQEDYPLSYKGLRLTIERDKAYTQGETYQGAFYIRSLKAVYPEKYLSIGVPDRNKIQSYSVYPNPTKDGIYVTGETNDSFVDFKVYNLSGQLVVSRKINLSNGMSPVYVSLKHLSKGVYMYEVVGKEEKANGKLVKE